MNTAQIAAWRMHNQRLWGTPLKAAEDVVRWLCAMQAQELVPAKWSVAQRSKGITDAAMDEALAAGAILRTHVVRPTWHLVLPEDIQWLLDITGPRVKALNAYYYHKFGLDEQVLATCNTLLTKALKGGNQLTRKEVAIWLERHGIKASGLHLSYILMHAELDAVVCSGAPRGKQQTYASFNDRVPEVKTLPREAALAELTRRYFVSRGPVTLKDYKRWSSLTAADAKAGLEMITSELDHAEINGRTYWFAKGVAVNPPVSDVIDLVQGYDECVMSYSETKDVLRSPGVEAANAYDAAYLHAILLNGQVVGHWKHLLMRREVIVETFFYRPLSQAQSKSMDMAVQQLGDYFGVIGRWR